MAVPRSRSKIVHKGKKLLKNIENPQRSIMVHCGPKWSNMVQNDSKPVQMIKYGSIWSKFV